MTRLSRQQLLADVTAALGATRGGERGLRMGLEVEFIPVRADSRRRVGLEPDPDGAAGLLGVVERALRLHGGHMELGPGGAPRARFPGRGVLAFEPGGQVEVATDAFASVDGVVAAARAVLQPLFAEACEAGIDLVARGMDPHNQVADVPLLITSDRYRKQRAHYDRLGPWGADMMLLSAGLHVNLDLGGRPVRRWWTANRLAPILTALFANSPCEDGVAGPACRSRRAEQWRHLDPSRTGTFDAVDDAPGAYLAFALAAHDFLGTENGDPAAPFRTGWENGADQERWRGHLTTLFPEVRPRGYLELRSPDTIRPAWLPVPLVVCFVLLYEPWAMCRAEEILPPVDAALLLEAGRAGVRDDRIRNLALDILDVAIEGARRLGPGRVGPTSLECVEEFRNRFTARGRDPGDEDDLPPFQL